LASVKVLRDLIVSHGAGMDPALIHMVLDLLLVALLMAISTF
jgi:hypothetical protein